MPGKLNGQMMAATPTGWRIMYSSTPRATSSEKSPSIMHRDAAGHLDVLDRAAHLPRRVVERLAVLHRDGARQVLEVLLEQHLQLEEVLDARGRGHPPPRSGTRRGQPRRLVHLGRGRQRRQRQHFGRCRVRHLDGARPLGLPPLAVDDKFRSLSMDMSFALVAEPRSIYSKKYRSCARFSSYSSRAACTVGISLTSGTGTSHQLSYPGTLMQPVVLDR